jgi:hypothetical protein
MARSLEPYRDRTLPDQYQRWLEILRTRVGTIPCFIESNGSPEGVINGQKGDMYFDRVANLYYYKTTNTGNTGWAVLSTGVTPAAGNPTEIQFNTAGAFAASPLLTWDGSNLEAPGIIAGDPGAEASGITIDGTIYDSTLKASALGGTDLAQFIMHRHSTITGPVIVGSRSNSDTAAHTLVTDNQRLLGILGVGWDGVDYKIGAIIRMVVDGVAAASDMPGRIEFYTTPAGSTVSLERLRISEDGTILSTATEVTLGTYILDTDQVVGAGQDNFVLTYDNGTGLISLEAAGGGVAFTVEPTNNYVGSLGEGATLTAAAADNFIAGRDAGIAITSGDANIVLGRFTGAAISTGGFNIAIGQGVGPSGGGGATSDKLYIGQGSGTGSPLLYGDISAGSKFLNVNGPMEVLGGIKLTFADPFASGDGPKFQRNAQYGAIIQGIAGSTANWALTTPTGQITLQNRTADGIGVESGGDFRAAGDLIVANGNPTSIHWETDGPADEKYWYNDAQIGVMSWILDNDLNTNPVAWATLTRTGVDANILNFIMDDVQLNGTSLAGGGGGNDLTVVTETTTTRTAVAWEAVMCDDDTAAATMTITLPAGSTDDQVLVKKLGTTADVIVDGDSAETIDGSATFTLTAQYAAIWLIWNGTEWSII